MFPRILHIYGPLWINGYGLMIALGFLLFIWLTFKEIKKNKIVSSELFFNTIFWGMISAILGGRIFYILTDWQAYSQNWIESLYPWSGGFSVLGSILGVLLVIPWYLKQHKIPALKFFDILATYAPLLQSISRIGCFLAGCCYGAIAENLFWAITFTNPSALAPLYIPLHPTQIYSSIISFLIFTITYVISKTKHKPGQVLFSYLFLESISRFFIDFFRGDRDFISSDFLKLIFDLFSCSQVMAILVFIISILGLIYTTKNKI
jgi:phosphatidylglycerol---prolipoprotein diacylglyceryl transferase